MRVTITGINFKYDNGFGEDYTGVELQFITQGFKFSNNTPVQITKVQYEANRDNTNGLRALIVEKILNDVNGYVDDLHDYKDSLQAE